MKLLTSFDKTEQSLCSVIRPEKFSDLQSISATTLIARGAGLSYTNASATTNGSVIDMTRMNRILEFNADEACIVVEAGLSIGELNNFLVSKGYIMPVLPGYPSITIGGCIAFNIHGKSQFKVGAFGAWVKEITLFTPTTGEVVCNNLVNRELFELTIGGCGLTGIITRIKLSIKKLPGEQIKVIRKKADSIYEAVRIMQEAGSDFEYAYSWNNMNVYGKEFGKGFVYLESYVAGKAKIHPYKSRLSLSYKLPGFHTGFSIRLMCTIYYLLENLKSNISIQSIAKGSFPIYGKEIYYNLFGKKGFREYQVLFPLDSWERGFSEIETLLKSNHFPIALGSLKLFKGDTHYISFTGTGICLTLNIQNNFESTNLFKKLDEITLRNRGIVNICKDSRLDVGFLRSIFSEFDKFREGIQRVDSGNSIRSELKTRLGFDA